MGAGLRPDDDPLTRCAEGLDLDPYSACPDRLPAELVVADPDPDLP